MIGLYLRSIGFCLFLAYLVVTGVHSFTVSEEAREADWSLNPEGDR